MCVQMTRCTQKHYDSGKILCDYKKYVNSTICVITNHFGYS